MGHLRSSLRLVITGGSRPRVSFGGLPLTPISPPAAVLGVHITNLPVHFPVHIPVYIPVRGRSFAGAESAGKLTSLGSRFDGAQHGRWMHVPADPVSTGGDAVDRS